MRGRAEEQLQQREVVERAAQEKAALERDLSVARWGEGWGERGGGGTERGLGNKLLLIVTYMYNQPTFSSHPHTSHPHTLHRESVQQLQSRLHTLEGRASATEGEVKTQQALLLERTNQIAALQRELDHRNLRISTLEDTLRKEKVRGRKGRRGEKGP